ncbi:phosphate ABC transporter permease PstA [Ureaplasma ceti]|uniref:Phosphate transport system permease protein PstA n=1 Tax=Ureaplasma ceti TaxID=3119530 RepID=A0ABP9UBL9_9BACT
MQTNYHKLIKSRATTNKTVKYTTMFVAWLLVAVFLCLIGYIIWKSVPGFQAYGFNSIILNNKYNINDVTKHQASVWLPLTVTIITTVGALLIATPLALKTATFLHFRVRNDSLRKTLKIIIETSAAIPSVIFGLFASQSLGEVLKDIFGLNTSYTVLTAIFMLAFMLIPTIISLTLNAYETVDPNLISNSISLGNTKTKSIYKIFRAQTRKPIIVAVILAAGRAIGETMAVSMILSSQNYSDVFSHGLGAILTSSLSPLGSVISVGMFSENGGESLRGLLYAFGIVMFIFVMILNAIVLIITNKKHRNNKLSIALKKFGNFVAIVPDQIGILWEKMTYKSPIKVTSDNYETTMSAYISRRIKTNKTLYLYSGYKLFWEILDTLIVFGFVAWITLDIIIGGIVAAEQPDSTMFLYSKNTTGQSFLNTILLILVVIIISLPLSLLIAIWLNEYAKEGHVKKVILFFIDSLSATPSIIFGMFGLAFFIQSIGISAGGTMGNSLLAGAFTLIIVVLPTFTRMIQQGLETVPKAIRENSYGLGNSKWYTISKLVLPQAYKTIVSSTILTIGRVLAETAPLYLTAGLSSSTNVALMNPGQTLTTRIYAQLYSNDATQSIHIMYESAFVTLLLVLLLTVIGHAIIPYWSSIKQEIVTRWNIQKMIWKNPVNIDMNTYQPQIYKDSILYLTHQQAKTLALDESKNLYLSYNSKVLKIKYSSKHELEKMQQDFWSRHPQFIRSNNPTTTQDVN